MAVEAAAAVSTVLVAVLAATAALLHLAPVLAVAVEGRGAILAPVDLEITTKAVAVSTATAAVAAVAARLAHSFKMAVAAAESVSLGKAVTALVGRPTAVAAVGVLEEQTVPIFQAIKAVRVDNMVVAAALHPKDPVGAIIPALEQMAQSVLFGPEQLAASHRQTLRNLKSKNEFVYSN